MRRFALFPLIAILCASLSFARPERMDGEVHRSKAPRVERRAMDAIRNMDRPSRKLRLRELSASEERPVSLKAGLVPSGLNRTLPDDVAALGEWGATSDGRRVWRLSVESSGAEGVRVKFAGFHIGSGTVWVLGNDTDGSETSAGPYSGDGPFGDGEFWSDIVAGDSVTIAWEPATGATEAVPFRVGEISHRFRKAVTKSATETTNQAVATCAVDVTCKPEFSEPASAVALMIFESGGKSYDCTGALVSSTSQRPFFATANHCIGTAEEAKSLISFFNYQTSQCNGTAPSLSKLPRVTGSTLVATFPMVEGDFTLLELSAFPEIDVKLLGWTSDPIAASASVTGISHPLGDYKRIALGRRTADATIRFSDGARMPSSVGYQVAWFEGVTQGGSSGSPLLVNIGGKEYLAGTLTAGPDVDEDNSRQVCRTSNLIASYGRFAAVYPSLSTYLTSGTPTSTPRSVLAANPSTIALTAGQTAGRTTLTWAAPSGVSTVQIRIGSATGPAMTGIEPPVGSAQTGDWVTNGMAFYLQDASSGDSAGLSRTITVIQVQTTQSGSVSRSGTLSATPISFGRTTISWQATGVTRVQIRVGSPTGPAMTGLEGVTGFASTGNWVSDGLMFYLQDASDGASAGSARTLATVRAQR